MKKGNSKGPPKRRSSKRSAEKSVNLQALRESHELLEIQNEALRRAQLELEISRERYADLFDRAPTCFVTLTATGLIQEINFAAMELLCGRERRLAGWPFVNLLARSDRKKFYQHLSRCRKRTGGYPGESVELQLLRQPLEKPAFIELTSILSGEEPENELCKSVFRDITKFRELQETHEWLAAIVESSDDAIIGVDLAGTIVSCNRGVAHLYGYRPEELVGKSVAAIIPPGLQYELPALLGRIRHGEKIEHHETIRQHKNGTAVDVSLTLSPIRDAEGVIIGASKIARDVSERKRVERELAQTLAREKAANRAKDDFLAALSHELRTPLNPVLLLASDAARNSELSAAARADFDTIRKNIELEARLIDDLLDLTRITRGKTVLNKTELNIHAVLRDALSTIENDIRLKMLALEVNLKASRRTVFGDAVRMQQILWNVLKNAVKFTSEGGKITVKTYVTEDDKIAVTIADTGIGMSGEEIGNVFNAFAQGHHSFGGLGLGLAISRALVELQGGVIHASSPGKEMGATFTMEFPLVRASEKSDRQSPTVLPTKAGPNENSKSHVRVLLVEDHEPTRTTLTRLLERRHYDVAGAASIAEARSIVEKNHQRFQLLISDIGLPDGNGYDLMRELKGDSDLKGIALTGYGTEDDVNRSQEAGFSTHLTKPVRVETLDRALAATLNG